MNLIVWNPRQKMKHCVYFRFEQLQSWIIRSENSPSTPFREREEPERKKERRTRLSVSLTFSDEIIWQWMFYCKSCVSNENTPGIQKDFSARIFPIETVTTVLSTQIVRIRFGKSIFIFSSSFFFFAFYGFTCCANQYELCAFGSQRMNKLKSNEVVKEFIYFFVNGSFASKWIFSFQS